MIFHTGWFLESLFSQTMVIHVIRTAKIPFIQSNASKILLLVTSFGLLVGLALPLLPFVSSLGFHKLPLSYYNYLVLFIVMYLLIAKFVKSRYIKRYKEWL